MIYFDCASTSLNKPSCVIEATAKAISTLSNPSRGAYGASLNSLRCMLGARQALADLFNIKDPSRVVFTQNATAALNIAINSIGGHIITTAAEHNSVLRPLYRRGNFSVVPLDSLGRLDIKNLEKEIKPNTQAIIMCHASNLTGNIFDIEAVGKLCQRKNLKFIVDAAQSGGMIDIDAQKCNISALCLSGHKALFAPQGIGVLCLDNDFTPKPLIVGGSGSETFSTSHPLVLPDALEAGTQNIPAIAGLLAGVNYINSLGNDVFDIPDRLAKKFLKGLRDKPVTLYGDYESQKRIPLVTLNIDGIESYELASLLFERYEICTRAGAHCAPLMHQTLGTKDSGAVRFSFSHFNTMDEIDIAIKAINEIIKEVKL